MKEREVTVTLGKLSRCLRLGLRSGLVWLELQTFKPLLNFFCIRSGEVARPRSCCRALAAGAWAIPADNKEFNRTQLYSAAPASF